MRYFIGKDDAMTPSYHVAIGSFHVSISYASKSWSQVVVKAWIKQLYVEGYLNIGRNYVSFMSEGYIGHPVNFRELWDVTINI